MWFGAKGDGSTDDSKAIQTAIDTTIRNRSKINTVFFPNASYSISAPLIMYYWTGTQYQGFTINLIGESTKWQGSGQGTMIRPTFKDRFALGVQAGKGCKIEGLYFIGTMNVPGTSGYSWFKLTLAEYMANDSSARSSTYSPYAGIVIDPFTNGALPPDGGYPGNDAFGNALSTYYRGTGSTGGSSATTIKDCAFEKFIVGICSSPNGSTGNADLTLIDGARFQQIAVGISSGQAQEKGCEIRNVGAWSNIHTFFTRSAFGIGTPGEWYIHNINVAGNVNTLIYYPTDGYFSVSLKYIFAESLGRFGTLGSTTNVTSIEDSDIGFAYNENQAIPEWHFDLTNVTMANCRIRYYGQNLPVIFRQNLSYNVFQNCGFEVVPWIGQGAASTPFSYSFINCTVSTGGELSLFGNMVKSFNGNHFAYGQRSIYMADAYPTHKKGFKYDNEVPYIMYSTTGMANKAIVISGSERNYSFTMPTNELYAVKVNDMLFYPTGSNLFPAGVIKTIDTGSGLVTMKWAGYNMVDMTASFQVQVPIIDVGGFMGDVTAGSPNITNVRADFGIPNGNFANMVGRWIKNRNFAFGYIPYVRVVAWDSTTSTLTVSSNSFYTSTGEYFTNAEEKVVNYPTANIGFNSTNQIFQKGMTIQAQNSGQLMKYQVVKTGYYNAAASPAVSESRYCLYVPVIPYYVSTNPEGTLAFPQGVTVINSVTGERYYKTTTDTGSINGGVYGWSQITVPNEKFTLTDSGSRSLTTGRFVSRILVNPTTASLSAFKIGTTNGGEEILPAVSGSYPTGSFNIIDVNRYISGSTTFYFGGVTGSANITIYYQ